MVIPFPLDHDQPFAIAGRDDAVLCWQRGLNVSVAGIFDGRAGTKEFPIYELQLSFGKRAASPVPQPAAPRGEDERPQKIADAFRAFADAMAGNDYDRTPCA